MLAPLPVTTTMLVCSLFLYSCTWSGPIDKNPEPDSTGPNSDSLVDSPETSFDDTWTEPDSAVDSPETSFDDTWTEPDSTVDSREISIEDSFIEPDTADTVGLDTTDTVEPEVCVPDCGGRECGSDSACGESCGQCELNTSDIINSNPLQAELQE